MELEIGDLQRRIRKLELIVDTQEAQIKILIQMNDNVDRTFELHKQMLLSIIQVLNLNEEERKLANVTGDL